ncbi:MULTISPECIES: hypothetical protein [Bradyrhizobium]|uniref:hypothetical protein n=1 Tax=Bradyrhizobium elkanii TaxID=29448 RepID=UPI0012BC3CDF|nr:hypothetical protein [Bradyrhizobium elkanii]
MKLKVRHPTDERLQVCSDHHVGYHAYGPKKNAVSCFSAELERCSQREPTEELKHTIDERADGAEKRVIVG